MYNYVRRGLMTLALTTLSSSAWSQDGALEGDDEIRPFSGVNLRARTLGGTQFWGDELVLREWRIQRNVLTGHFRLLDERNVRHAWGAWEACAAKLAQIQRDEGIEPLRGKVVVLLHGLGRSRSFMRHFARHFSDEGDYSIVNVEYPSTRADIASHAQGLAKVIDHLGEVEEINFVAHSLGNLVVRHYLHDAAEAAKAAGKPLDPRIKRFVMVGPPNHGAAMARLFEDVPLYDVVLRGVGRQLADFAALDAKLGSPPCEFAIIAGGKGDDIGWNPLLAGDDDILVKVEETKLVGARDFRLLNVWHARLGSDPEVLALSLKFLQEGCFTTNDARQPIAAPQREEASP
jgi:pimeloyl-ACP methyl ester carboxylesterase